MKRFRRWRPVFSGAHGRAKLFFYSDSPLPGAGTFFHQHRGDHRPHLHLSEGPHHAHERAGHPSSQLSFVTRGFRSATRDSADHRSGHWHSTFAEDSSRTLSAYFVQVMALVWVTISDGPGVRGNDIRLAFDQWARPPP